MPKNVELAIEMSFIFLREEKIKSLKTRTEDGRPLRISTLKAIATRDQPFQPIGIE